jgi:hypothetical protein
LSVFLMVMSFPSKLVFPTMQFNFYFGEIMSKPSRPRLTQRVPNDSLGGKGLATKLN